MVRLGCLWLLFCFPLGVPAGAKPTPVPPARAVPPGAPPTMGALYRLATEFNPGLDYRGFIRLVPNAFVVNETKEVVGACRRLGLEARHRKANWSEIPRLNGPFLAKDPQRNWLLYRMDNGMLYRLESQGEPKLVTEAEFLQSWTYDLITIAKGETMPAPPPSTARIQFTETKHDFGASWQGDKLEHLFVFENVGSGTLEITQVHASCGCTAALVGRAGVDGGTIVRPSPAARQRFLPGESGHIQVVLNTAGKRGPAHSSVTVATNDPTSPSTLLQVHATVKVPVEVNPSFLMFGRVTKTSPLTRPIRLSAPYDADFRILDVTASNPRVHLDLNMAAAQAGEATGAYVLDVTLDISGLEYEDRIDDTIVVRTNSERAPSIPIRVNATVSGEVIVSQNPLLITPILPNRETVRMLMVVNNGPTNLEIREIRNSIPNLTLNVENARPGKQFRIMVTLKAQEKPEPVNGEIVIVTNHPEQSELRVRVTGQPLKTPQSSPGSLSGG